MTTVGEAVATLEQRLFVARRRELDDFRRWLLSSQPGAELLNVSGPPGVGKSTLVRAFVREARMQGWNAVLVDGHRVGSNERDLIQALNDGRSTALEDLVDHLNRNRSLILIDTFEQLEHLSTFLQASLLPRLNTDIKVVIAGRRPLVLAWSRADGWPKIVKLVPLEGFSSRESRAYLALRGITKGDVSDQIVAAAAGNPLALSVAADLISQLGVRNFAAEWHRAGRSLVRRLLSEAVEEEGLIAAVEASSVVRIFDEATLYAITRDDDVGNTFDRLCRLSIIKPAENGLTLHDHVRAIISNDLRWRRPHHHQTLRQRALEHFKERLRTSTEPERGWLISECFFLWDNPIVREIFFGPETLGSVTVEPAVGIDPDIVVKLHGQGPVDSQLLREALAYAHTRVRVARTVDGLPAGFSIVVPICQESIALLEGHPIHAALVNAYFVPSRRALLPRDPQAATTYYLLPVVAASDEKGTVRCALFRELAAIFGLSGTYLCMNHEPMLDRLLVECDFEMVVESHRAEAAFKGWVLDLTRVGFDGWIQTVIDGRQMQAPISTGQLETEILSALAHWDDSAWLAGNCRHIARGVPLAERAETAREAICEALSRARANGVAGTDKALRALELGYMKKSGCHKQAMRTLSVSRATFYRLCRRGAGVLAEHLITCNAN